MTIKIGDKIEIINPELFVRCGYPIDPESEDFVLSWDEKSAIEKLLVSFGFNGKQKDILRLQLTVKMIHEKWKHLGCGGNERTIYTSKDPFIKIGDVFTVYDKFRCVTGTYVKEFNQYDYFTGIEQFDPAHLENQKHHTILECSSNELLFNFKIESKNVKQI